MTAPIITVWMMFVISPGLIMPLKNMPEFYTLEDCEKAIPLSDLKIVCWPTNK